MQMATDLDKVSSNALAAVQSRRTMKGDNYYDIGKYPEQPR